MRITDRLITDRYMTNLNRSLSQLNDLNERVSTGRSYTKASEDPACALKAYKVRSDLSRISLYKSNLEEAGSELTERESALTEIGGILSDAGTQLLQAVSDTSNESDRKIIASLLRGYQEQLFNIGNTKFGSKFIFGGEDMRTMPFSIDGAGTLLYQGLDTGDASLFEQEHNYFDVGLGLRTDGSGQVVPGTGLDMASPGSALFGVGTDADGISDNLYNLLGQIADKLENDDMTGMQAYTDKLDSMSDLNMIKLADVGEKCNFIDFLTDRFTTSEYNAMEKQQALEGVDSARAILEFNMQETAYNAALSMGTKILQYTLLDYLD